MSNIIPDEIHFNRIDRMDCIGKRSGVSLTLTGALF